MKTAFLLAILLSVATSVTIPADSKLLGVIGRTQIVVDDQSKIPVLEYSWSAVRLVFTFVGSSSLKIAIRDQNNAHRVYVDGKETETIYATGTTQELTWILAQGLDPSVPHSVQLMRLTESLNGVSGFINATLETKGKFIPSVLEVSCASGLPNNSTAGPSWHYATCTNRRIEFIGNSITCGYGNEEVGPCQGNFGLELSNRAYGYLTGESLHAQTHINCWSGIGLVRNNGPDYHISAKVMFNTHWPNAVAGVGYPWDFDSWVPNAVVFNLGTNDYSNGKDHNPTDDQYINMYIRFIRDIYAKYSSNPKLKVFLGCGPMTTEYCDNAKRVVKKASALGFDVRFVDLEVYNGDPKLVGCLDHPSAAAHVLMARNTANTIKEAFGWK